MQRHQPAALFTCCACVSQALTQGRGRRRAWQRRTVHSRRRYAADRRARPVREGSVVRKSQRAAFAHAHGAAAELNIQVHVDAKPASETDVEVRCGWKARRSRRERCCSTSSSIFGGIFRVQNVPAEQHAAGRADRVPAPAVSVRARDRRRPRCAMAASRRSCSIRSISSLFTASGWRRHSASPPSQPLIPTDIIAPNRLVAERGDEAPVRRALLCGHARRKRHRPFAHDNGFADPPAGQDRLRQDKRRLARADQLHIDFGEQLGVEQRAVLGAA